VPGPGKAGAAGPEGEGSFTLTLPAGLPALGEALAGALVERLGREGAAAAPQVEVLASSPGPGLGGGAVDADVARQVLWPQLRGRNGLGLQAPSDADWRAVEAVLLTVAEDVKVGLAMEATWLERTGGPDPADRGHW
jgi:hypothetical protein